MKKPEGGAKNYRSKTMSIAQAEGEAGNDELLQCYGNDQNEENPFMQSIKNVPI